MTDKHLTAAAHWCRLFVDALCRAGVNDVVVSPGSRSTPLVWAFAESRGVRIHSVHDERSAGFMGLGLAKTSRLPVALLCTSGSAPAHYFPAVIEASETNTSLVVLSADRPAALHDVGANQTVDQTRLFGHHVRWFFDATPDASADSLRMAKRIALQAVTNARGPRPGPVHVNLRFEKPLEPDAPDARVDDDFAERLAEVRSEPFPSPPSYDTNVDPLGVVVALARAERPLVVAGSCDLFEPDHTELFEKTGLPLFADATSGLRLTDPRPGVVALDAFDAWVGAQPALLDPDLILQLGGAPTSSAMETFIAGHRRVPRWVVADHGFVDPWQSAAGFVLGNVKHTLTQLAKHAECSVDKRWRAKLERANELSMVAIDEIANAGALSEASVAKMLVANLPRNGTLALGNSLPVRTVNTWVQQRNRHLHVLSRRGTSGIDGLVASAVGATTAGARPLGLLLGDVSLLHDLGSLELVRHLEGPFVIVVVNNDGGRIFGQLPVGKSAAVAEHMDLWSTPHGLRFEGAARMFGIDYARVTDREGLERALSGSFDVGTKPRLIEATVSPTDDGERRDLLRARLSRELEGLR